MLKTYLSWTGLVLACAVIVYILWPARAGSDAEKKALAEGRTMITYWDRCQGHEFDMHSQLIAEFNASQNEIFVRTVSIGWRIEKLLTAIASGAPDACSLEGNNLSLLGYQDCFLPLEDWLAEQPGMKKEDFFPHAWDVVSFNGHVWGVPTTTDSYCLLWNKSAFRRAGLDPEKPPTTLKELQEYAKILTIEKDGNVPQIGFLPWLPWDFSYMWGGFFGGKWVDDERTKVIAGSDQKIIDSYAWQGSWVSRRGDKNPPPYALREEIAQAFYSGFSSGGAYFSATNPFYTGKVAMVVEGEWQCTFIPKYAPNLDWGVAPIPQPEGTEPRCFSPTCVLDAIPVGSRHVKEAKTFLKWFYSTRTNGGPSPASDYCFMVHNVPTLRADAAQERFVGDPKFKVFVDQLQTKPAVYFQSIPIGQVFSDGVSQAREFVIFGERTPAQAVQAFQDKCNEQWSRVQEVLDRNRKSK